MANRHYSGHDLHQALCAALGVEDPDARGSRKRVYDTLTAKLGRPVSKQLYTNVIRGTQGSLDTVCDWCHALGVGIVKAPGQPAAFTRWPPERLQEAGP